MSPDLALVGSGLVRATLACLAAENNATSPVGYLNQGDAGTGTGASVSVRLDRIVSQPFNGDLLASRADWVVQYVRNDWPKAGGTTRVTTPTADAIDEASQVMLGDIARLYYGLQVARSEGWLADEASGVLSDEIEFGPMGRIPPDSGVIGWQLQLSHPMPPGSICVEALRT